MTFSCLSSPRSHSMPFPLYLLAMAVFAMGTSEFMLAGLLPDIASDLDVTVGDSGHAHLGLRGRNDRRCPSHGRARPQLARHDPACSDSSSCSRPPTPSAPPPRTSPVLFATRVVAALANAGFLAVALTTAATLVPPAKKGRALAVLLSGTTVATIAGVPGGSLLGTLLGWRATFWAVAALCLPAALGIITRYPRAPSAPGRGPRAGLAIGARTADSDCGCSWSCCSARW